MGMAEHAFFSNAMCRYIAVMGNSLAANRRVSHALGDGAQGETRGAVGDDKHAPMTKETARLRWTKSKALSHRIRSFLHCVSMTSYRLADTQYHCEDQQLTQYKKSCMLNFSLAREIKQRG